MVEHVGGWEWPKNHCIAPETLLAEMEPIDSSTVDLSVRPMKQASNVPR